MAVKLRSKLGHTGAVVASMSIQCFTRLLNYFKRNDGNNTHSCGSENNNKNTAMNVMYFIAGEYIETFLSDLTYSFKLDDSQRNNSSLKQPNCSINYFE